ncbi:head morphogenesis protein [Amorphus sp. MBR-141]
MARSLRRRLEDLLASLEPTMRDYFLASIIDIRSGVTLRVLVERLERGDVNGAIEALNIEPEAFDRLSIAIREAYGEGGRFEVDNLPRVRDPDGARVVFRFGVRNLAGEQWLQEHSSQLITRVTADQIQAAQVVLEEGLQRGQNPRTTALDLVGRVSRATNSREGGTLGLTTPQTGYVLKAKEELLSGDPESLKHYLTRGRRDKRFDRTVMKAIREGKPVPADMVTKITGRYADGLLNLRGETVAQKETMTALAKGRFDAMRQQIDAGKVDVQDITKEWRHSGLTENARVQHVHMHGKSVGFEEDFIMPDGTRMKYPHDPDAPIDHTAGCHCTFRISVDYTGALARRLKQAGG